MRPDATGRSTLAVAAAIAAIAALLAYPLRHASPVLDDFIYFALAAHVDSPWPLVAQDAIGSYFYRPLGLLAWWGTVAAFGSSAPLHYGFNIALHAFNALLLFHLARAHRVHTAPAALAALVFLAHPTAFAAAAWLSDRFDLLTATFGLCALIAVERHAGNPRMRGFILVLLAALGAILSKETGFALLAAAVLAAAWPAPGHSARPRQRAALIAGMAVCALAVMALRWGVLRASPESHFLAGGIGTVLLQGSAKWAAALPGFLFVGYGNLLAIGAWGVAAAAVLVAVASTPARRALFHGSLARTALLGLALLALAAAAQSPVTNAVTLARFESSRFDYATLAASRFYYVPLLGLGLALAAALEALARLPLAGMARVAAGVLAAAALAGLVSSSRAIGRDWSAFAGEHSAIYVTAAVAAAKAQRPGGAGCLVFLLDTPPQAHFFRSVADTAVKHGLPRGHPAMGCFFQAEHAPWSHLVAGERAFAPMENIHFRGKLLPPLRVGNLTHYYLQIPPGGAALAAPQSTFLSYREGRFVDVTAEVRAGTKKVELYDNRPPP